MVTNYAQQLTAILFRRERTGMSVLARAVSRLGEWLCGMTGHDTVMHFEGKRVMMRCTSCGYDSPGWEISDRGPRRRFDGDPRRHLLEKRPRLVLRKTG